MLDQILDMMRAYEKSQPVSTRKIYRLTLYPDYSGVISQFYGNENTTELISFDNLEQAVEQLTSILRGLVEVN